MLIYLVQLSSELFTLVPWGVSGLELWWLDWASVRLGSKLVLCLLFQEWCVVGELCWGADEVEWSLCWLLWLDEEEDCEIEERCCGCSMFLVEMEKLVLSKLGRFREDWKAWRTWNVWRLDSRESLTQLRKRGSEVIQIPRCISKAVFYWRNSMDKTVSVVCN